MGDKELQKLMNRLDKLWVIATNAIRARDYGRAIKSLQVILQIDEKNASAHNRLGIVYAKTRDYKQSIYHFKKATKYEKSASSEHNLGLIYYETGQYRKAKKHLEAALQMETLAIRHVAIAKVLEKLGKDKLALEHLESAMKLEPNRQTQQIYIDAYARYGNSHRKLSEELLEAIQKNNVDWEYEVIDNYPLLIELLQSLHKALQEMVFSRSPTKVSLRDENAKSLMIAYLHNLNACIPLLSRNYSLASANIARSMFEIYLQIGYGTLKRTNVGFAEIERSSLIAKKNANNRLFKKIRPEDDVYQQKVEHNRDLIQLVTSLDKRYKKLDPLPSYREIAVLLDKGYIGENYFLYEQLYEKGSDIIHAERSSISRSIQLSNTRHAGLFMDSYAIINNLINLTLKIGDLYSSVPSLGQSTRAKYQRESKSIKKSLVLIRQRKVASSDKKLIQKRRVLF